MRSEIEVPDGWKKIELKDIAAKEKNSFKRGPFGGSLKKEIFVPTGYKIYEQKNAIYNNFNIGNYCITKEKYLEMKGFSIKKDDIIISCSGTLGKIAIVPENYKEGIINQALLKISVDKEKFSVRFIKYSLESDYAQNKLINSARGAAIKNMASMKLIKASKMLAPPLEEQQKIADILSKVDEQIELTEKIIDKTEELKKGLMQNLLTKGIRHTKFKKTELGEMPEEWDIKRLDVITEIIVSNVDKKVNETEEPVLLCNYKDVYDNDYICSKLNFMKGTANKTEINRFSLNKDDVIITKDSETKFDIAVPSVVIEDLNNVVCGYHLAILRPKSNLLDGLYLMNVLKTRSVNNHFVKFAQGLTRFGLTIDAINRAKMPLPPLNEQKQIASILSKVDEHIQDNKKELNHLKELKKGLMQDLLTGKVRVTV